MPSHRLLYHLGPLSIAVQSDDEGLQQQLATSWQQLLRVEPVATVTTPLLTFTLTASPTPSPLCTISQAPLATVQIGRMTIARLAAGFVLTHLASWLQVADRQVTGYLAASFWTQPLVEQRDFWQRLFFLLVRGADCHLLHANALLPPPAVMREPRGLLLVGDCGAGKTTLTLSLIAAGWRYVADDSVLVQSQTTPLTGYALRRGFACTDQTALAWPWLEARWQAGVALNRRKRLIDLADLDAERYVPACQPYLLCFPRIVNEPHSRVTALTPLQSLTALLGQLSNGLLVEPTATPTLLQLYQQLATHCGAYQLAAGPDVLAQPAQVSDLLVRTFLLKNPPRAVRALGTGGWPDKPKFCIEEGVL